MGIKKEWSTQTAVVPLLSNENGSWWVEREREREREKIVPVSFHLEFMYTIYILRNLVSVSERR